MFLKTKIFKKKFKKNSLFTIKPDIRYPAKLLVGYPAKSVSGTTLVLIQKKLLIMLCMKLLFMCMKQKCNFYFQQYDVRVTFVDFYASFLGF